jgi:hypothetical protein
MISRMGRRRPVKKGTSSRTPAILRSTQVTHEIDHPVRSSASKARIHS